MKEQGYAGTAAYSLDLRVSFRYRLTSEATVFTAEAWAILQSLILIQDTGYFKAVIFFDSKSVLEFIGSNRLINSNYIIHWKRLLAISCSRGIKVTLVWIPAHRGIPGNEIANKAAKEATLEGRRDNFKLPTSNLILEASKRSVSRFNKYFEDISRTTLRFALRQLLYDVVPEKVTQSPGDCLD